MPMKYLLDTHTWIWWNMNPEKLSKKVESIIQDTRGYNELLLSAISPWEFSKLLEKKRLGISCNPEDWIKAALEMPKLRVIPLYPILAYRSTVLPQPFHDDPVSMNMIILPISSFPLRERKLTMTLPTAKDFPGHFLMN